MFSKYFGEVPFAVIEPPKNLNKVRKIETPYCGCRYKRQLVQDELLFKRSLGFVQLSE